MTSDGAAHITSDKTADSPSDVSIQTGEKRGPKSCRTPGNRAAIEEALCFGLSRAKAAAIIGVTYETLRAWAADDPEISAGFAKAEAEGTLAHAKNIHALATNTEANSACVTASKFYLTTHDREAWTEKTQIEHSGSISISDVVRRAAEAMPNE